MPTLPAQHADTTARRQREADQARALLAPGVPGVFACAYWRGANSGVSADVLVKIAHHAPRPAAAGMGPGGGPPAGMNRLVHAVHIQVAAVGPDETISNGITGSKGGVVQLQPQDCFLAPGAAIGSTQASVNLRVKDGSVRRTAGWFTAEVAA